MVSTYSSLLRLELMATGDQSGTWGVTTNTNLGTLIEQAIAGRAAVSMPADANYTLTTANGATDEARQMILNVASGVSLTATRDVIVPTASKLYVTKNATTGAQSIRVKTAAGTGITIPNGKVAFLAGDATNVIQALDWVNNLDVGSVTLGSDTGRFNATGVRFRATSATAGGIALMPNGAGTSALRAYNVDDTTGQNVGWVDIYMSSLTNLNFNPGNAGTGTIPTTATFAMNVAVNGNTTIGDAFADTLTLNAGTWTIGASGFSATRSNQTQAAGLTSVTNWTVNFTGDPGGTSDVRAFTQSVGIVGTNNIAASYMRRSASSNAMTSGTLTSQIGESLTISNTDAGAITNGTAFSAGAIISGTGSYSLVTLYQCAAPSFASTGVITTLNGFLAGDLGNATKVTTAKGFVSGDMTAAATLTVAFESQMSSGTGKWGFRATGTANHAFNGNMRVGSTAAPVATLDVTGTVTASSTVTGTSFTTTTGLVDFGSSQLRMDSTDVLALRDGVNAQTYRIYGTFTDASNFERLRIGWDSGNSVFTIATESLGTGSARGLSVALGGSSRWQWTTAGHYLTFADNTYDIGASGANRPRDLNLGRNALVAGQLAVGGSADSRAQVTLTGSFTGSSDAWGLVQASTLLPALNGNAYGWANNVTLTMFGSGTHPDFVGARFAPPTINGVATTITNASTVKITGDPTTGTNKRGLWNVGTTFLDGATTLGAALTYGGVTLTNAVTGTGKMVLDTSPTIALASASTGTTQTAGDNSTKLATTAYVDRGSSGASWVLIDTQTASNSATVDFTSKMDSTYDVYVVLWVGVTSTVDGQSVVLKARDAGGVISSGYAYFGVGGIATSSTVNGTNGTAQTSIFLIGITSGSGNCSGSARFEKPSATNHQFIQIEVAGEGTSGNMTMNRTVGKNTSGTAITGCQFSMTSGNINTGSFYLYGIRKS